jgi:NADH-quinone oxidoreductase subunit C
VADETAGVAPETVVVDAEMAALQALPGAGSVEREHGALVITSDPGSAYALLQHLRDAPEFAFAQVMDICGVDWPDREQRFEVVYNLLSVSRNARVRVIVPVAEGFGICIMAECDLVGTRNLGSVRYSV